ncbi:MFS transporter [bacterium]|nr:MFS transporter [bacterium]
MNYSALIKTEPRPLLFATTNSFFSCYGQSHFLALFSLIIFEQYKLTNTQFGTLYAGATLLTAAVFPFIGPLVDSVDIRKYCLFIAITMGLGYWLLLSTPFIAVLFIALFLLRLCGQGLCTHVNGVCTARYFGKNRG